MTLGDFCTVPQHRARLCDDMMTGAVPLLRVRADSMGTIRVTGLTCQCHVQLLTRRLCTDIASGTSTGVQWLPGMDSLSRRRHIDHSGGIPAVVRAVGPARADAGRPPMVLDVHPDRPRQRGVRRPQQAGGGVLAFSEVRCTRARRCPIG